MIFQTHTRHLVLVFLTVTLAVRFQTAHPVPVADAFVDINPDLFQTAHLAPVADVFVYINLVMFQTAHPTPVTCILTLTL